MLNKLYKLARRFFSTSEFRRSVCLKFALQPVLFDLVCLRSVVVNFILFYFPMLGKWFRMPGHSGSYCGGSGRKCGCSRFQRRPGNEASRQGGPGTPMDVFMIALCLNVHVCGP